MIILNTGSKIYDDKKNKYELLNIIGRGGFGHVFKAIRKADNKYFAVKSMLPSFGDGEDQYVFENEIDVSSKISGKNIIKYEFVNDGKTLSDYPPFIIMEYANNGTLKKLLADRNNQLFSNEQIISMFTQLANGMKIINQKLVHRDIKPENILIDDNTLKITDFGLSKIVTENTRTNTFKGWGTYLYMSPEAWTFAPNTIQMDIYSMGIVFFEIASLQYPYASKMDTIEECKRVHLNSGIKNLYSLNPNLNPTIVSVINKMLEKSEKRRFKDWEEIISFLNKNENKSNQLTNIVNSLIITKTEADIKKQRETEACQKQIQEEKEFYDLVKSQFNNDILSSINKMIDTYNSNCADNDKFTTILNSQYNSSKFYYEFKTQFKETIVLGLWAVKENSLQKEKFNTWTLVDEYRADIFGPRSYTVNYTLTYKDKPVIGLVKIFSEDTGLGFNLMLVKDSGIYGDWYILKGQNNFSLLSNKARQEPFYFDFDELSKQIDQIQTTGLYSLQVSPFTEDLFLENIVSIIKKY